MQVAAVEALRALAHEPVLPEILQAYGLDQLEFGPDYFIPKPFDPRLMDFVPPAVAQAAVDSGVARSGFPPHYKPAPVR
jgi:malate dehydrogenase (oxaloacetate-decarboxylating)(NADP+)